MSRNPASDKETSDRRARISFFDYPQLSPLRTREVFMPSSMLAKLRTGLAGFSVVLVATIIRQ
jgi:hypothetical protein